MRWLPIEGASWLECVRAGHPFGFVRAKTAGWIEQRRADRWTPSVAGALVLRELEAGETP